MISEVEETRNRMLRLINSTQQETQLALSGIDPDQISHAGSPIWLVRDVVGHLGVWNGEAAKSLHAHAEGRQYFCITSETKYDEYNGQAVEARRTWTIEQVWAEYDESYNHLKLLVGKMPYWKWKIEMLFPWNESGTIQNLIEVMMKHENEHREIIQGGVFLSDQ